MSLKVNYKLLIWQEVKDIKQQNQWELFLKKEYKLIKVYLLSDKLYQHYMKVLKVKTQISTFPIDNQDLQVC